MAVIWMMAVGASTHLGAQTNGTLPPARGLGPDGVVTDGVNPNFSPSPKSASTTNGSAIPTNGNGVETRKRSRLDVEAFVYVDESGSLVLRPGMTWEEYERILQLESGQGMLSQSHRLRSLAATGEVSQEKASLQIVIELDVENTSGRWKSLPLRMSNFHPASDFQIEETLSLTGKSLSGQLPVTAANQKTNERQRTEDGVQRAETDSKRGNEQDKVDSDSEDDAAAGESVSKDDESEKTAVVAESESGDGGERSGSEWGDDDDLLISPPNLHRVSTTESGDGFVLWSMTNQPCRLTVKVPVSVLVRRNGAQRSVSFDLPNTPGKTRLTVPGDEVVAQVVGRGSEVLSLAQARETADIEVESAGGQFDITWTEKAGVDPSEMLLDANADVEVTWDAPQDQPIQTTQLRVENLRGDLSTFVIELPDGSTLLDAPSVSRDGAAGTDDEIELQLPEGGRQGGKIVVMMDEGWRAKRVDMIINLQIPSADNSREQPLTLEVPRVRDAIRQRGELRILCSNDFRLRWLSRPWVRSVFSRDAEESSSRRTYRFDVDRGSIKLPMWLAAKSRQLRLESDVELALHDSAIRAVMTVRPTGQMLDGRGLKVDLNEWVVRSISDLGSGSPLDSFSENNVHEIEVSQLEGTDLGAFQIVAEHTLPADGTFVDVRIPRIVEVDRETLVSDAELQILTDGRRSLVVDLENSIGLDRVDMLNGSLQSDRVGYSSYRILPTELPTRLVGNITEQPQRVTLMSDTKVELDGDALQLTVDWTVTSQYDLEGRLPVRILNSERLGTTPGAASTAGGVDARGNASVLAERGLEPPMESAGLDPSALSDGLVPTPFEQVGSILDPGRWMVTVDGSIATMRSLGGDRFEIVSERLTSGSRSIRWRYSQDLPSRLRDDGNSVASVPLPRPDTSEVVLRGVRRVVLIGDRGSDLISGEGNGQSQLDFDTPPREPLRVRLRPRSQDVDSVLVRRAVIRSVIGANVRHEQVFAQVEGGTAFRIRLFSAEATVSATATIDGQTVKPLRRGQFLEVELPTQTDRHSVELNLWIGVKDSSWGGVIYPKFQIAAGVEQAYWQIVTPRDQHVIWASPTVGRAMSWEFDGWRLARKPIKNNDELAGWVATTGLQRGQIGNTYLYAGTSVPSFSVVLLGRSVMWLSVGTLVLVLTAVWNFLPRMRHPAVAIVAAVFLSGILVVAPDAAVLAGQWLAVSMVLLVVMHAVRSLMVDRRDARVLSPASSSGLQPGSTRDLPSRNGSRKRAPRRAVDPDAERRVKDGSRPGSDPLGGKVDESTREGAERSAAPAELSETHSLAAGTNPRTDSVRDAAARPTDRGTKGDSVFTTPDSMGSDASETG